MDERREIAKIVAVSVAGVTVLGGATLVALWLWGGDGEVHADFQEWLTGWLREPEGP